MSYLNRWQVVGVLTVRLVLESLRWARELHNVLWLVFDLPLLLLLLLVVVSLVV